jgi:hypothetical protein
MFTETQVAALLRASRGHDETERTSVVILSVNEYVVELAMDRSSPIAECVTESLLQAECGHGMRCAVSSTSCSIAASDASDDCVYFPVVSLSRPRRGDVYVPYASEADSVVLSESAAISGLVKVTSAFRIALEDETVPCVRLGRVVSGLHRIQHGEVKVLRCD